IDDGAPYEWLAFEQVPTVLPVWEAYADHLRAEGYSVATGVVHAEQYGVPQTRKRAILVARRDGREARLPAPTHSRYYPRTPRKLDEGVLPWVSMAEALGATAQAWEAAKRMGSGMVERHGQRPGRPLDVPAFTIRASAGGMEPGGFYWRPVVEVDGDTSWTTRRPSPTVVGSFRPDVIAAPGYRKPGDPPRQKTPGSVRVTHEEAATLQSFPPGYPWQGSSSKRYQQIGNAVPPLLARAILAELTR